MIRTTRLLALFVAIVGVQSLSGQEPKKQPAKVQPVLGDFKSIDADKKTITVETGLGRKKEIKSFPLADSVEVKLQMKPDLLKLSDLIPGDLLSLTLDSESKNVTSIGVEAARIPRGTIKEIDLEKKIAVIMVPRTAHAPGEKRFGENEERRLPLGDNLTVEKYFRTVPIGDVKPGMVALAYLGDDRKSVSRMIVADMNGPQSSNGRVQAFDATKRTITVHFGSLAKSTTYTVAENAAIKILDTQGHLTDLVTGTIMFFYYEKETIIALRVSQPLSRRGNIAKLDLQKSVINIKIYDETITCAITPETKIRQSLKDITVANLKEGQEVDVQLSADKKIAESITVSHKD